MLKGLEAQKIVYFYRFSKTKNIFQVSMDRGLVLHIQTTFYWSFIAKIPFSRSSTAMVYPEDFLQAFYLSEVLLQVFYCQQSLYLAHIQKIPM